MLRSDRPGTGGNVRRLLAKVSPVRGWPTHHSVNSDQGWQALDDAVTEIPVADGNQARWLLLVVAGVVSMAATSGFVL